MKPSPTTFPDNAYHIVFGCDDNYIKYASVAMISIIYAIEPAFSTPESLSNTKNWGGGGQDTLTQDEAKGKSLKSNPSTLDSRTSLPALQAKIHHFTKYANIKPLLHTYVGRAQAEQADFIQTDPALASTESLDSSQSHSPKALDSSSLTYARTTTTHYAPKPIAFHLITDTLTPTTKAHLRTLESTLSKIYPTTITIHQQSQQEFSSLTPWGEAGANWCAYFRLKIGEILPQSARRCLYLDTDTLILQDIRELFTYDLGQCAIGAVRSGISGDSIKIVRERKIRAQNYFNSGVLLIDLSKWRTKDLGLIHTAEYAEYADQDFLNLIFKDSVSFLPYAFNLQWLAQSRIHFNNSPSRTDDNGITSHPSAIDFSEFASALLRPAIVHLLGGYKPWEKSNFQADPSKPPIFVQNPYHKLWWKIAAQSPFATKLRLAYARRASRIWLSCYLLAYAPTLYAVLHMMKRAVKRIIKPTTSRSIHA